jgi:hypothetical protein
MRWTTALALIFVLASGGVLAWFFVQDQPAQALASSMKHLASSRVIMGSGSMYWQNVSPSGQGEIFGGWISLNGTIDLRAINVPQISGVAGYDATQDPVDFQSADIITDNARVAFRPHVVSDALVPFLAPPEHVATGTWVSYQRNELFNSEGLQWAIASGTAQMISSVIASSHPETWFKLVSAERGVDEKGHDVIRATIRPNADRVSVLMFNVLAAWKGKSLNAADAETMQRIAHGMELGTWVVSIDRISHHIRAVSASWPMLDVRGNAAGRISVQYAITRMGTTGAAPAFPKDAVDVTDRIRTPMGTGGFGISGNKATSTE